MRPAGTRRNLKNHPEPQIDGTPSGRGGRHDARRRDHAHEPDAGCDVERQAQCGIEKRNEEHSAADAEQCAERAGEGADADHDDGNAAVMSKVVTMSEVL